MAANLPWAALCRRFPLVSTVEPQPLNDPATVFKVRAATGDAVLKHHWFVSSDRYETLAKLTERLSDRELIPQSICAEQGEYLIQQDSRYYSLSLYIDDTICSASWNIGQLAKDIARMHLEMNNLALPQVKSPMTVPMDQLRLELQKYNRVSLLKIIDEIEQHRIPLPQQVIHNDLHPANCIQTEENTYILDLDSHATGYRLVDALFAVLRFTEANSLGEREFLSTYANEACLTNDETAIGPRLLTKSLIEKLMFIFREAEKGNNSYLSDTPLYEALIERSLSLGKEFFGYD